MFVNVGCWVFDAGCLENHLTFNARQRTKKVTKVLIKSPKVYFEFE